MFKKIIGTLIVVIVFVLLIWGGIHYTLAKIGFEDVVETVEEAILISELIEEKVVVGNIETSEWFLILEDGSELVFEGRALLFAVQAGFVPSEGDNLKLKGFVDELGSFEIVQIENLKSGANLNLRDEAGKPLWGRGGGGKGK